MTDATQQQINAARQREQGLRQRLAQLKVEVEILSDLVTYLRVICYDYEILMEYQQGSAPGATGIVLNQAVCLNRTSFTQLLFYALIENRR